jgi:hypothetical protein
MLGVTAHRGRGNGRHLVPESGWKYGSLLREASHEEMSNDPAPTRQNQNEETMNTRLTRRANASREPLWKWLGMKSSNVGQGASMRVSLNKLKVELKSAGTF